MTTLTLPDLNDLTKLNAALQSRGYQPLSASQQHYVLNTVKLDGLIASLRDCDSPSGGGSRIWLQRMYASLPQGGDDRPPVPAALGAPTVRPQLDEVKRATRRVFGGNGALCFFPDLNRDGLATMSIDAARPRGQDREYDWKNKINVQLTLDELIAVACVLFGFTTACEFAHHGERRDKAFEFKSEDGTIFVAVRAPGSRISVPIDPSDVFMVSDLVTGAILANTRSCRSVGDVANLLKLTAARATAPSRTKNRAA